MKRILLALLALFPALAFAQVGGGFPPAPSYCVKICGTACSIPALKVGQAVCIVTTGADTVTSSTSIIIAPHLNFTSSALSGGTQLYEYAHVSWSGNVSAGAKFVFGNATPCNTGGGFNSLGAISGGGTLGGFVQMDAAAVASVTASGGTMIGWGLATGNNPFGVCFAQNVSNAAATQLNTGSMLIALRVQ